MPWKDCDHTPVQTAEYVIVDGKVMYLYVCAKCGEELEWK